MLFKEEQEITGWVFALHAFPVDFLGVGRAWTLLCSIYASYQTAERFNLIWLKW